MGSALDEQSGINDPLRFAPAPSRGGQFNLILPLLRGRAAPPRTASPIGRSINRSAGGRGSLKPKFIVCSFLVFMSAVSSATAQSPQIEKGRQVVAQVCAACHTTIVRMIQVHKQTPEQWKDTVYFMISRGAQIMPDEIEPVVSYLASAGGSNAQTRRQTAEVDGAAILQRNCQQCHELAVASKKADSENWDAVIARMMTYGARLSPADRQKLTEYLGSR
jgi:cytochrome c5